MHDKYSVIFFLDIEKKCLLKNLKSIGREIYYLYDAMSGPLPLAPSAETTSFSETSEFSSPEEIIEEIVVTKEKKDKCYKPKKTKRFSPLGPHKE